MSRFARLLGRLLVIGAAAALCLAAGASFARKPITKPAKSAQVVPPAHYQVLWGGQWWAADVIGQRDGFRKVHYAGWGTEWDEWVEVERVRKAGRAPVEQGEAAQVKWGGRWYDARVLESRSGLHRVHYVGWDARYDQWVEPSRIRYKLALRR